MTVLSETERRSFSALALVLALILMLGFLPTSNQLGFWLTQRTQLFAYEDWIRMVLFPLFSLFFAVSLPVRIPKVPAHFSLWKSAALPILLSILFGLLEPSPRVSLFNPEHFRPALWFIVCIPLGEELLFRGWCFNLFTRLSTKFFSLTHPIPSAIVLSSLGFSLWHLQNLSQSPAPLVFFQVVYTFFTGLWLGYLRYHSGALLAPIAAHSALNAATLLA